MNTKMMNGMSAWINFSVEKNEHSMRITLFAPNGYMIIDPLSENQVPHLRKRTYGR